VTLRASLQPYRKVFFIADERRVANPARTFAAISLNKSPEPSPTRPAL
jgi:hypothetical protein